MVVAFAAVLIVRWHSHYSNTDDFLYALQTQGYYDGLRDGPGGLLDAWREFGTNTPLMPTLALPVAPASTSPHVLVLVQIVPLLVLVAGVRVLLGGLGVEQRAAWVATAAIATLAPVLAYAAMWHFALAATACTVWAVAAYARSDRLARPKPALLLGLALGLLSLTRVMAPVYIVALAVPIAIDVLSSGQGRLHRMRNGAGAALVAVLAAAPWWLTTGETAFDYLRSSGYEQGVFTRETSLLDRAIDRLEWTADETGWLLALLLVALAAWALVCVVRRVPGWRLLAVLLGAVVVGMAFLATSSNLGTAFALPFVVLLACAAVPALLQLGRPLRTMALAASCAVLAVSLVALTGALPKTTVADHRLWNEALPGVEQARAVLRCDDCRPPDSEQLAEQVLAVIGERPTLVVRDDALLNAEGLRHVASERDRSADLSPPAGGATVPPAQLARVDYVLTGLTVGPYHPGVDLAGLDARMRAAGFRPALDKRLSAWNTVTVWAAPSRR